MSRLDLSKNYSLEGLAEDWGPENYMNFRPLSTDQVNETYGKLNKLKDTDAAGLGEIYLATLKNNFAHGKVTVQGELVDAERDDLDDIPVPVRTDMFNTISFNKFLAPKE